MRVKCCVLFCSSSSYAKKESNLRFFRWPTDKNVIQLWLRQFASNSAITGFSKYFKLHKNLRICSLHFEPNCFNEKNKLLKNAVPSLFRSWPSTATLDEANDQAMGSLVSNSYERSEFPGMKSTCGSIFPSTSLEKEQTMHSHFDQDFACEPPTDFNRQSTPHEKQFVSGNLYPDFHTSGPSISVANSSMNVSGILESFCVKNFSLLFCELKKRGLKCNLIKFQLCLTNQRKEKS
ncbi:uncharacterized protein LOC130700910 [Daphnia carinata]|uniref:uncharacterized protein LOC130700910 n=1 Tax=Daphnia carinata TaxID=120202 RepID=UPI00257C87F3|nr:uncharacterized protein LOC130700910 [Daphnia carinata]